MMNQHTFALHPVLFIYDGKVPPIYVFQNPNKELVADAFRKVDELGWEAFDCTRKPVPKDDACHYLMALLNDISNLYRPIMDGRVLWNIANKDLFVAQVRSDVLNTDFSKFTETTEQSVLVKLVPIIPLLDVGMYATAIGTINALVNDEYITSERKTAWVSMLTSANAIP